MRFNSPTKFGKGVGLLWRGCGLNDIYFFCKNSLQIKKKYLLNEDYSNQYLFESARSALFVFLCSIKQGKNHKIVVSSFTCEAVTYAIIKAGFIPVYVDINEDLTMNEKMVFDSLDDSIKAVIVQNTFGRIGLSESAILKLKNKGYIIIEDCALSYGSLIHDKSLGSFGDASIFSLEASKTVTVGWGGIIRIQNEKLKIEFDYRFNNTKRIFILSDFKRIVQLWLSVFMVKVNKPYYFPLWYFLYGLKIFRTSNRFSNKDNLIGKKMGILTQSFFYSYFANFREVFQKANSVYLDLAFYAENLGLRPIIMQKSSEIIVTPRISFFVNKKYHLELISYADSINVEVGRWFSESPPRLYLDQSIVHSSKKSEEISQNIVNFSSHFTLSKNEINSIKKVIKFISKNIGSSNDSN